MRANEKPRRPKSEAIVAGETQCRAVAPPARSERVRARLSGERSAGRKADRPGPAAVENQTGGALHRPGAASEIDPAFESVAGVADKTEATRLALDDAGLQNAPSSSTVVVVSLIPECSPPMMPASPAALRVGDQQQIRLEVEYLPVEERELLARRAKRTTSGPFSRRSSYACSG